MKNRHHVNVFKYLEELEIYGGKEKHNHNSSTYITDDSDEDTNISNKNLIEDENYIRNSSKSYFKENSSSSSAACDGIESEKENKQKSFTFSSKGNYTSDDFEILNIIGSGAFAKVYKARHKKSMELFALKEIDKILMRKNNKLFQIYIENEFLNSLNHPNIIKTYGIFEDDNKINLVLEYGSKGTLSNLIEKAITIDKNITIYYIGQLICAIEYLHSKKIVHRDIKPENLVIDNDHNLKLIDFGTACYADKYFDEDSLKYITEDDFSKYSEEKKLYILKNQICQGTPNYMSPEIINSNSCGVYSDLWSVGCILYNLIYGYPPFNDKTDYLIFQNIINLNFRFPLHKSIYPDAKDLIKNFLILDPMQRLAANGKFDHLKNHKFFYSFIPLTIEDDLENMFNLLRNRRFSIDLKDINKNVHKVKSPSKFLMKKKFPFNNEDRNLKIINTEEKETPMTTNVIMKHEDFIDFDEMDNFEELQDFEINENKKEIFIPIEKIESSPAKKYSEKEFSLKYDLINEFELDNYQDKKFKEIQKKIEEKKYFNEEAREIYTNTSSTFKDNKNSNIIGSSFDKKNEQINIAPISRNQIQEKNNLDIFLSTRSSSQMILKIGNLKMLGPWCFYDTRKIILYKNLNLEYYDADKNEIKGIIHINQDFIAVKKDKVIFDLICKEKTFSFICRKEEEAQSWVDIINRNILEYAHKFHIRKIK